MENYDKIRVVGRGAYGVCWLCRRKEDPLAQKVIVKTIFIHGMSADEEKSIMGDFIAGEVKLLQKMHHPMIIGYYDYFVFENQLAIVMQKKTLIKLSDFGISKELTTRSLASTVIGTPNYLSPEICEGRAYNQKSDLWSLGAHTRKLAVTPRRRSKASSTPCYSSTKGNDLIPKLSIP
ncbi:unnamed protein product [Nippostrongylus brasiliensis]|uniref:non-specific serine/threonine protein kinase n=1 Tax=Nippostrongylus brasiliensis TaxID=27835 RepID=A0A158R0C2_NIPBR|nr:unnamed protein product [Nippostrongylus brasiliensis]